MTTSTPAPDLLALDRQVCFALAVASRSVIGVYRPLLEPLYFDENRYGTYLEQLGIQYPTLRQRVISDAGAR